MQGLGAWSLESEYLDFNPGSSICSCVTLGGLPDLPVSHFLVCENASETALRTVPGTW